MKQYYDLLTQDCEYLGTYRAKEISEKIGIKIGLISGYSNTGHVWNKKYRFEKADIPSSDFAKEWDEARMKLLKRRSK